MREGIIPTELYTTNKDVKTINERELAKLRTPLVSGPGHPVPGCTRSDPLLHARGSRRHAGVTAPPPLLTCCAAGSWTLLEALETTPWPPPHAFSKKIVTRFYTHLFCYLLNE
jgi:hypothetical protein